MFKVPPSPSPLRGATSPPVPGGEDGRQARLPSSPSRSGGEVAPRSGDGEGEHASRSRRTAGATSVARSLRRNGTKAEALLWMELKARRLGGLHFVRQLPIGRYVADFACRKHHLVIELDGSQHADSKSDRVRDEFFREAGWSTVRFWNDDVLRQRDVVCATILAAIEGRLSEDVAAHDLRFIHSGRKRNP
jgi:very-short-patch-repair endonuclease